MKQEQSIILLYSVLTLFILISFLLRWAKRVESNGPAKISEVKENHRKATLAHLEWLRDNPFCDGSHPEAQKLLRKRINAYGLFLREYPSEAGEHRIRELTQQLEMSEV